MNKIGIDRTLQDWFFGMSETADDHFTYVTGQGNNRQFNEPLAFNIATISFDANHIKIYCTIGIVENFRQYDMI